MTNSISVLHIITGLENGGAESTLYRLLCRVEDPGRHWVVSLGSRGHYGPLLEQIGVRVLPLDFPRGWVRLHGLWQLWRLLRQQKPEVVQTWMYHADLVGGVLARLAGCRNLYWNVRHSNHESGATGRSTHWVIRLCAWLSGRLPRRIVCCARAAIAVHQALGYRGDFVLIPNGYDLQALRPDPAERTRMRSALGIDDETLLLGMVARYNPQKDHAALLTALAGLVASDGAVQCVLVGNGCIADNPELQAQIDALGLADRVRLLGPRDDIPALLNALDVHVLSSRFGEAFPNVVAEAMACGTPCVVTRVGDAATIVEATGWVADPGDRHSLQRALESALQEYRTDPAAWVARGQAARARIETCYSIEAMVEAYQQLWEGLA